MTRPKAQTPRPSLNRRTLILGSVAAGVLAQPVLARQITATKIPAGGAAGGSAAMPAAPSVTPLAANPAVDAAVAQVSQDRILGSVEALSSFPTRLTEDANFFRVEDWVSDAFIRNGAPPAAIQRQGFVLPNGLSRNNVVVGNSADPRGVIVVGAHFDTYVEPPQTRAPGANDNASGVAVMLEAYRLLSQLPRDKEIVFAAFGGEEQDLLGSTAFVENAQRAGWRIDLMVNLDMLGLAPRNPRDPIVIEYDQGNAVASNNAAAREYGLLAAQLAAVHSTLSTVHTDIWDTDYMPFEAAGYPSIGFYDNGADAPEYHTSNDTMATMDFDRLEQVARIVVATLATTAGVRA